MASSNSTELTGVLSTGDCKRGVSAGPSKPNGGGTFVYAFNTVTNTPGAVARYANQVNFAPMALGGEVTAAMRRGASGGLTGFSAFIFAGLGGTSVNDICYMLGLSDGDPSHIELRKGSLAIGLPDEVPGGANVILRQSTEVVAIDEWKQLRLELVTNGNGDVVINCFKSDLVANAVTAPVWVAIPGMASFIDDALGIASGSAPLTSGRGGWGAQFSDVTRRVYFDQFTIARQTP